MRLILVESKEDFNLDGMGDRIAFAEFFDVGGWMGQLCSG